MNGFFQIKTSLIATAIALVVTIIIALSVLSLMIKPQQQELFHQKVENVGVEYSKKITRYIEQVENNLIIFSETIPSTLFDVQHTSDGQRYLLDQWLNSNQHSVKKSIPELQTLTLYSTDELDKQRETPRYKIDSPEINFLLIDMVNRINNNQKMYLEVAKGTETGAWYLHRMVPIKQANNTVGFLHVRLTLNGIQSILTKSTIAVGELTLLQFIDNFKQFQFLTIGQGSDQFSQKVYPISSSYWQLWYRPSIALYNSINKLPAWYLISIPIVFMFLFLSMTLIFQRYTKRTSKITTILERPEQSPSIEKSTATQKPKKETPPSKNAIDEGVDVISIPENIFRAYDIRGIAYEQLTPELAYAIGCAVASEVIAAGDNAIILGRDARTHSAEFSSCMSKGIVNTGCDVIDIGLVPTPLLNFTTHEHPATSSGIIITASHNPKEYNGCKIIVKGNTLVDGDIQRIKQRIIDNNVLITKDKGKEVTDDLSQAYIDRVANDIVVMPGTKIVVDAANGAASELAPRLLHALGCKVIPLFCSFDGEFPNHDPDPSVPKNLQSLQEAVIKEQADIGLAFDGDGDRLVVVTQKGNIIWPDQLLMIFAQDIVARHPACDVVFDVKSTSLLPKIISDNGGRPIMWKTGHSHIKSKMKETGALLGGEYSGHIFFKERWFGFDDGLYAAVRLLELMALMGQSSEALLAALPIMFSTPEIKIAVTEESKTKIIEKVVASFELDDERIIGHTTIDGFRVDFVDGWGLIRASNTSPSLTLRFEAESESALEYIKAYFRHQLNTVDSSLIIKDTQ